MATKKSSKSKTSNKSRSAALKAWKTIRARKAFYDKLTPSQKSAFSRRQKSGVDFDTNKKITIGS